MTPPAIVSAIVWPFIFIMEFEKAMILTVFGLISARLIAADLLINPLPVQPFIEGTAVVEDTINDHLHAPAVYLIHKLGEKCIAGLQIFPSSRTQLILGRFRIVLGLGIRQLSAVLHDFSVMRVDMVIILGVILVVGRGYEHRVKIQHFHAQVL